MRRDFLMRKIFLFACWIILAGILSSCIISSTPDETAVVMKVGETITFEVEVFPIPDEFVWYMDSIPGVMGATYEYSPTMDDLGDHTLVVKGGEDTLSWFIHVIDDSFVDCDTCVEDVEYEFASISTQGEKLSIWDNGLIPWPRYTQAVLNGIGIDNHFQGIQRLRKGPYIVISGSNIIDRIGSIFIARLGSRPSLGAFWSNLDDSYLPPIEDKLIEAIDVDSGLLWHAGGMSVAGDILVVPVEEYKEAIVSKVYFFDVSDPEDPVMYDYYIDRTIDPIKDKAGAVAITKLPDGRFILATWDTRLLHFYLSNTTDIIDGFDCENVAAWDKNDVQAIGGLDTSFAAQTINFISQCDGELYLVALDGNNGDLGPFLPYLEVENWAELFHVEFPDGDYSNIPIITKVASKEMYCDDNPFVPSWRIPSHCDFAAAAGVYIDPEGTLSIYSAPHYRSAGIIKFSEFLPE